MWKKLLIAIDLVEHLIIWQLREGNSDIWLDNWTRQCDLYTLKEDSCDDNGQNHKVKKIIREGDWISK